MNEFKTRDLKDSETPENSFAGKAWMRRLVRFDYQCRLCGAHHVAEHYLSVAADNLDDYAVRIRAFITDPDTPAKLFQAPSRVFHQSKGDFNLLVKKGGRDGFYQPTQTPKFTITSEQDYTCDDCHRIFPTNLALRDHGSHCS